MADKVFGITELLENILMRLPTKDLLFAQKVCKQWQHVIASSTPIQKALFFAPGTVINTALDAVRSCKPLFDAEWYTGWATDALRKEGLTGWFPETGVAINPLLCDYEPFRPPTNGRGGTFTFATSAIKAAASGSCYKMLITQPSIDLVARPLSEHRLHSRCGLKAGRTFAGFMESVNSMLAHEGGKREKLEMWMQHYKEPPFGGSDLDKSAEYCCRTGAEEAAGISYVWKPGKFGGGRVRVVEEQKPKESECAADALGNEKK